jgi:hypothetical protein
MVLPPHEPINPIGLAQLRLSLDPPIWWVVVRPVGE